MYWFIKWCKTIDVRVIFAAWHVYFILAQILKTCDIGTVFLLRIDLPLFFFGCGGTLSVSRQPTRKKYTHNLFTQRNNVPIEMNIVPIIVSESVDNSFTLVSSQATRSQTNPCDERACQCWDHVMMWWGLLRSGSWSSPLSEWVPSPWFAPDLLSYWCVCVFAYLFIHSLIHQFIHMLTCCVWAKETWYVVVWAPALSSDTH